MTFRETVPTKRITGARVENRWERRDGEPTVRAGKGLQWMARYIGSDGEEHSKSFRLKKDATAWLKEQDAAVTRGEWVDPAKSAATVGEVAKAWLAGNASKTASTADSYKAVWTRHVEPRWGKVALKDVVHDEIVAWVGGLTDGTAETTDGLSASSVRHCHAVLHQILALAVRSKRLRTNPAKEVPLPEMAPAEKVFLDAAQIERLARAADWRAHTAAQRMKAGKAAPDLKGGIPAAPSSAHGLALRLLGQCGLRFGELAGLRVSRVEFDAGELVIDTAVSEVGGKLVVGRPKNKKTRRVFIPSRLEQPLKELCAGRDTGEFVFTTATGTPLRRNNFAKRVLAPAAELAGVDSAVTLHSLRHSFASVLRTNGEDLKQIQEWMGHHSIKLTGDLYGHIYPAARRQSRSALDAAFGTD
ncbi:tyrosine-type recombinase/integrase [Nocardia takedensis]|uniref:tyrosine-type recombinase/integrase n=1 Tax=Nocardia takedensis TaxID=259390 RepID=UPI000A02D942|nr:site-specific integrase [Nocardia takedensis]